VPSYSPVFSQGFIYYTPDTPNIAFEVPEGFTAVLRDASYYDSVGAGFAAINVQTAVDVPWVTVIALNVLGVNQCETWSGRVVIPGGGVINLYTGSLGSGPEVYVGGYLLRNSLT